jgi:hypothetical protein
MIARRRLTWTPPLGLAAVTAALLAAVVIARQERPSRGLRAATPGIINAKPGAAPEIGALNAQLAQIAALRAGATYGVGLGHVVRGPVPSLRAVLGEEWRELQGPAGDVVVRPSGRPSRYFEVGFIAVSQDGRANLALSTSAGQHAAEPIVSAPYSRVNFGPLLVPKSGPIGLTINSLPARGGGAGPRLIVSPVQAEYLAPGEWVTGMPALAEFGPGGQRGVYLASGSTTRFAMTPGIAKRCLLELHAASVGGPISITTTVGRETRTVVLGGDPTVLQVGPFSRSESVVSLSVRSSVASADNSLFISRMRFIAAQPGG